MDPRPVPRPVDRQGLEVLDDDHCLELIDLAQVGRVAFVSSGEPHILPVNHVRLAGQVHFRSASGLTLLAATRKAMMAFEVDDHDEETRTGWSVLVRGPSHYEEDEQVLGDLEAQDLHPWADQVERRHWVTIAIEELSGRRIPNQVTST
jgi:nitroimidazol reductase NimA-like FMN-containing flavoprotein (pyridoxamine 5'-phosphate oxidase superfamily)